MKIVFLTHPPFIGSQSMPRFAGMLEDGMVRRGHEVIRWTARPFFYRLALPPSLRKWLGYLDQYLIFPLIVRKRLKTEQNGTLFVIVDQALGPWVPLVADRRHAIHCHDFLAQKSALGMIPENPTGKSGAIYQAFIRRGYQRGRNFISVSEKTKSDLSSFLSSTPAVSEVVYNGLNPAFVERDGNAARLEFEKAAHLDLSEGYVLHVGANQWYKNRMGVVEIYDAWREANPVRLPLILIGPSATKALRAACAASPFSDDIHLLSGLNDEAVRAAYAGASVFVFPSLAEGFGWPIAEAMASGCPVITTAEAPMTEVAGDAAFLIPRRPIPTSESSKWAVEAAEVLQKVLSLSSEERNAVRKRGMANSDRFNSQTTLDRIESIYVAVATS